MQYPKVLHILLVALFSFRVVSASPLVIEDPLLINNLATSDLPLRTNFGNQSTVANSTLSAARGVTSCIAKGAPMRDKYRPLLADCYVALRQMPSSSDVRTFCDSPDVNCRLPAGASKGNCKITVRLVASAPRRETSSWVEIGLATMELLNACQDGEKSAGTTLAGNNDNIEITVSKDRDG